MMDRSDSPTSQARKRSQDLPLHFKGRPDNTSQIMDHSDLDSYISQMSDSSAHRHINMKGVNIQDDKRSQDLPLYFKGLDNTSLTSLRPQSVADSGYESMNLGLVEPSTIIHQQSRLNLRYAAPGDVACDLCEEQKLKACKSCMTCLASFCEIHVKDHYVILQLQRHSLVEVTKNLNILQDNAQLKKMILDVQNENLALKRENEKLMKKISELRLPDYICRGRIPVAENLTMDPATAHRTLTISHDGKRVRLGKRKDVQDSAQKFDKWKCVLATEGFSSGRHYWEVDVNREFTIGVTRQFAQRRGNFSFSPNEGYWCLYRFQQSFTALDQSSKRLQIDTVPQVLGVCIDVDEKWVTFYNSQTKAHIHTFHNMVFTDGEKIYPVFNTLEKSAGLEIKTVI